MIAESVHAMPACTGDYIVFGPEFQSEFALEVDVEVFILLSVGWLGAAHFNEGFGGSWLKDLKEFLFGEKILSVVK